MFETIYSALTLLGEEGIVWFVFALLVVFFLLGLRFEKFRRTAPALMTSLGILGTFCGIFIALYPLDFSPGKMNDSIEALLNGMTTAFVTSLLGIAFGILFRVVENTPLSAPVDALLSRLMDAPKEIPPEQREILDRLDAIKQAIAGDGDSSMVTQMQKMRDENRDGFKKLDGLTETIRDALVKNLEGLTQEIRDIIGKQLGESLQTLIANIEKALIEQFGKTFIEFNAATQALKKWQEDHRTQVEQLTDAFNLAAMRIAQIAENAEKIPPTMEQLKKSVEVADREVVALNRSVEAFANMRQQAEQSFPVIKKYLDQIGTDLKSSAAGFTGLESTIRQTFENADRESKRLARQHLENVESVAAGMRETLEKAQRDSSAKVASIVTAAIEKFSGEIDRELDRIARAWGNQMVSIAERCAEVIQKVERSRR